MNFRLFIYYSALCGGWAAFLTWLLVVLTGLYGVENEYLKVASMAALLGAFVGAAVGFVDALLNQTGAQRIIRAMISGMIGTVGGLIGGLIGQATEVIVVGWVLVGIFVGVSVGLFDLILSKMKKGDSGVPVKKTLNGIIGGTLGGLIGGALFYFLYTSSTKSIEDQTKLVLGLVLLGLFIGLMIGLAQVFLKEAWIKVEVGRRAGKEMMLSKDLTTIGRAESCDIGLFGEQGIEREHARIVLHQNRYFIEDAGTPGGTFVNDQPVAQRAPLQAGDAIRVGSAVLRFGERQKQR